MDDSAFARSSSAALSPVHTTAQADISVLSQFVGFSIEPGFPFSLEFQFAL
jgi:hypothetical protein